MGYKIPLAVSTINNEEIDEVIKCLNSGYFTMGKKTEEFEKKFANYVGAKYAVMVNSGSSANLLAMFALVNPLLKNNIKYGDEVIVPSVSWSTTVFPVLQAGAIPVFVDCDSDYQIDADKIEDAISDKTRAIIPTHILGNVSDMKKISKIAQSHNLYVIEDSCESLGSKIAGKYVGTFGDMGTYSFYFSHHITTIEGGMLVSDNEDLIELIRVMRHHGLVRDSLKKDMYIKQFPDIDPRFMFVNMGFNLRPTDLNAVIGIKQLDKLDSILRSRRENAEQLLKGLNAYKEYLVLPKEKPNTTHSWFSFPLTVKENKEFTKDQLVMFLESKGIETRPLVAGNLVEQPVFRNKLIKFRISGDMKNANNVNKNSFYFGMYQNLNTDYILNVFNTFFNSLTT